MDGYVQSAVVQGRVYLGGCYTVGLNKVLEYNTRWVELPLYETYDFGMTVINNQLVLVGGWDHRLNRVLGVWEADDNQWTHPYPEMPTAHARCSTAVYSEWLIVAGGMSADGRAGSSVEVMNINAKQWSICQPTPIPWHSMKAVVIGDMCYFMGGYVCTTYNHNIIIGTDSAYCVSILQLLARSGPEAWKEIAGFGVRLSAPIAISGCLYAVGGSDRLSLSDKSAIHLYNSDTGEWTRVGDLPAPRCNCTCAMLTDQEVFVAGGTQARTPVSTLNFALIIS